MIRSALALSLFATSLAHAAESEPAKGERYVAPAVARLEGIGGIFGLAAGASRVTGQRLDLLAGVSTGEVRVAGASVSDIPLGLRYLSGTFGLVHLDEVNIDTAYGRGLSEGERFRQRVTGRATTASLTARFLDERLSLSVGALDSLVKLDSYRTADGRLIPRPRTAGYHDIETFSKVARVRYDSRGRRPGFAQGWSASLGLATAEGRIAQSDALSMRAELAGYAALAPRTLATVYLRWGAARALNPEANVRDAAGARAALNTGCDTLSESTDRANCERLENAIAGFIAANNAHGSADPLGGSNGLRSYGELQLKAARTQLVSFELRQDVTPKSWNKARLEVAPFVDVGWAADPGEALYARAGYSTGAAIRVVVADLPYRLAAAWGPSGPAWLLTLGQAW